MLLKDQLTRVLCIGGKSSNIKFPVLDRATIFIVHFSHKWRIHEWLHKQVGMTAFALF